jgi:hypothetical protein
MGQAQRDMALAFAWQDDRSLPPSSRRRRDRFVILDGL